LRPEAEIFGVGGTKMQAAGVALLPGIEQVDAIGMIGIKQLRAAIDKFLAVSRFMRRTALDAVVFIDNPGLNLRLARVAKRYGHRVVYYIAPQIWAWNPGRIRLIARVVDRMLVILPFEEEVYRKAGVPCEFVGHPLLDAMLPSYDREALRKRFGHEQPGPLIGLLPGSREQEVRELFPVMLEAADRLKAAHPGLRVVIARAATIAERQIAELGGRARSPIQVVADQPNEVMAAADLLFVASGTATLQAAIIGTPMIILYRVSWLTALLARLLVRINCIGLVNIVAGERFVTELLQQDANPRRLSEEGHRLLSDPEARTKMCERLRAVRDSLGAPGASKRAAAAVLAECKA
jgi:lipid-A-disaccharide synthase